MKYIINLLAHKDILGSLFFYIYLHKNINKKEEEGILSDKLIKIIKLKP